jgi:hypothetical protein
MPQFQDQWRVSRAVPGYASGPFAEQVRRLGAYRGIDQLGALTLASEVCDFRRFASAQMFMGFCGLVPSEHSSGERTRRGRIASPRTSVETTDPSGSQVGGDHDLGRLDDQPMQQSRIPMWIVPFGLTNRRSVSVGWE